MQAIVKVELMAWWELNEGESFSFVNTMQYAMYTLHISLELVSSFRIH